MSERTLPMMKGVRMQGKIYVGMQGKVYVEEADCRATVNAALKLKQGRIEELERAVMLAKAAVRYTGEGTPTCDRAAWELFLSHAEPPKP